MTVRRAKVDDAEAIVTINVRTWKESYKGLMPDSILEQRQVEKEGIISMRRKIQDLESIVLVYEDEEVLGYLSAGSARDERDIKYELRCLYILPEVQHKGIGTKLFVAYKEMMKGKSFYLYTLKNNPQSRSFYEKNGGVVCEEFNRSIAIQNQVIEEVGYIFEQ